MKVLVDTSVRSEALRRNLHPNKEAVHRLSTFVENGQTAIIGPIKQELVSGIKSDKQFQQLCEILHEFPNETIIDDDYLSAASLFNRCRKKGFQGSHVDFLICAVSRRLNYPIFTLDNDFINYGKIINIKAI